MSEKILLPNPWSKEDEIYDSYEEQLALKEADADNAEDFYDDSDYLCHGCGNHVEIKAEFCPCGVCPDCCTGAICEAKFGDSACGHCSGDEE